MTGLDLAEANLRETKQQLLDVLKRMKADKVPRGLIENYLRETQEQAVEQSGAVMNQIRVSSPTADTDLQVMSFLSDWIQFIDLQRHTFWQELSTMLESAQRLEDEGKLDAACALYETLALNQFIGTLPYDRLRIIYTRQKRYADAIRVCDAYLSLPDRPNGQDKPHFQHHRANLQAKLEQNR